MKDADLIPLEALLGLARSISSRSLAVQLERVTQTILDVAGYRTVVLNQFRPQWDEFEATLVLGDPKSRATLLGSRTPLPVLERLLEDASARVDNVHVFTGPVSPVWDELARVYVPDLPAPDDAAGWHADDALLALLVDTDGEPLGFLSMDEPISGRRPAAEDLQLLALFCSFAEQALRTARHAAVTERDNRLLARLTEISSSLLACDSRERLHALVVDAVERHFGFEHVAIYQFDAQGTLQRTASAGRAAAAAAPEWAHTLASPFPRSGCWLLAAGPDDEGRSARNGRGPRAWHDHLLLVPWTADGRLHGAVVVDDPSDRLLPSRERQRTLRLLIDLAASAQMTIDQRARLDHLATHDDLTGIHNRRGLDGLIGARAGVALLLCDIDHFKRINDRFGHEAGDRVLARFGELLRELAREDDIPIRLGGEEFCVILPRTDAEGARVAAERLRVATSERLAEEVPGGVTISIGVAFNGDGALDARTLLTVADRGLYEAKAGGRNRTVVADDD